MFVLSTPVAGGNAGKFPAQVVDDVWVRVVLDVVHEAAVFGHVLQELVLAVGVDNQIAWDVGIVGGEEVEDGRVDGQVVVLLSRLIEDLGKEPWTNRVERIATRHAERDRFVARDGTHQIDAAVVGGFGFVEAVSYTHLTLPTNREV